ncbi:MAG: Polar-differentiation response regulator DivK [Chroococcidiopsis sp. SAG 2025]|uniref:response regulator n=1 Tax=Chroococcidiopsis sp. SAG 2025 TaxID=171389 RepID=UPI00293708EA|nr:response regulator [Chroococcidiopsis sp. SAG 2025]MDV2997293.1 Polar-differentiation response regulator DivK [Chroococcidiopsis sp. SAG 2025]
MYSSNPNRILIVDNDESTLKLLHDYLQFHGYEIFSIARGANFFQTLSVFQPQLIVLDLRLPEIDGFTLLEQLKQRDEWQSIPVIIISALASQTERQRAYNLGAKHYFVKPANLRILLQTIQKEFQV